MFWRFGFHAVSAIDGILDREDFTLYDLLNEDELLQECKSHNKKLVEYLAKKPVLEQLINLLGQDFREEGEEVTDQVSRRQRYPGLACDILSLELWSIYETVANDQDLLRALFAYLERPVDQLSHNLASYFARIVGVLLSKKTTETLAYIKTLDRFVDRVLERMVHSGMQELIMKLVGCESSAGSENVLEWLNDQRLIPSLVARLSDADADVSANASQTLIDIISYGDAAIQNALIRGLMTEESFSALVDITLTHRGNNMRQAMSVVTEMLHRDIEHRQVLAGLPTGREPQPDRAAAAAAAAGMMAPMVMAPLAGIPKPPPPVCKVGNTGPLPGFVGVLIERLGRFVSMLDVPDLETITTTYGVLTPPVGLSRLKVLELFVAVNRVNYPTLSAEVRRSGVLGKSMDLFFHYLWNDFLHNVVEELIRTLVESEDPVAITELVTVYRLHERLLEACAANKVDEERAERSVRRGYMGHVVLLSNMLVAVCTINPEVAAVLTGHAAWQAYVQGELAVINDINQRVLGGVIPSQPAGPPDDDAVFTANGGIAYTNTDVAYNHGQEMPVEFVRDDDDDDDFVFRRDDDDALNTPEGSQGESTTWEERRVEDMVDVEHILSDAPDAPADSPHGGEGGDMESTPQPMVIASGVDTETARMDTLSVGGESTAATDGGSTTGAESTASGGPAMEQ